MSIIFSNPSQETKNVGIGVTVLLSIIGFVWYLPREEPVTHGFCHIILEVFELLLLGAFVFSLTVGGRKDRSVQGKVKGKGAQQPLPEPPVKGSDFSQRLLSTLEDSGTDEAFRLLKSQDKASPEQYDLLIQSFLQESRFEEAEDVFEHMKDSGVVPSSATYKQLLIACSKAGLPVKCKVYFDDCGEGGHFRAVAFSAMVYAYVHSGDVKTGKEWVNEMFARGVRPAVGLINTIVNAHASKGELAEAEAWMEWIFQNNLDVNVLTYTCLIDACAKSGAWQRAEVWFSKMIADGIEPTVVTYSSMINAFAQARLLNKSEEYFQKMLDVGFQPTAHCFGAMIKACTKARLPDSGLKAEQWIVRAEEAGQANSPILYSSGVDAAGKVGDIDCARRIMERMKVQGFKPVEQTYCALARAYGYKGMWEEIEDLGSEMVKKGVGLNEFFLHAQLMGYSRCSPPQRARAEKVFSCFMRRGGANINFHVLNAFEHAAGPDRAKAVLKEFGLQGSLKRGPSKKK